MTFVDDCCHLFTFFGREATWPKVLFGRKFLNMDSNILVYFNT